MPEVIPQRRGVGISRDQGNVAARAVAFYWMGDSGSFVGLEICYHIVGVGQVGITREGHVITFDLGLRILQIFAQIGRIPGEVCALHRRRIAEILEHPALRPTMPFRLGPCASGVSLWHAIHAAKSSIPWAASAAGAGDANNAAPNTTLQNMQNPALIHDQACTNGPGFFR